MSEHKSHAPCPHQFAFPPALLLTSILQPTFANAEAQADGWNLQGSGNFGRLVETLKNFSRCFQMLLDVPSSSTIKVMPKRYYFPNLQVMLPDAPGCSQLEHSKSNTKTVLLFKFASNTKMASMPNNAYGNAS